MNRNAIIMAAGMSSRFVPLSLETPKSLLNVKGEILIERQIRQLREAGIKDIIVVVGYLKEKFEYLKEKYNVILLENPYYKTMNNFSTLYVAKEYLGNTYICSSDNYFIENVFLQRSQHAYYATVYESGRTEEWCLELDDNDRIIGVKIGGENAWIMKGHVFFSEEFSAQLIPYLEKNFSNKIKWNKYWEDLFIEHTEEMLMFAKKYSGGIIEEFDSLDELREFDNTYIENTRSKIIQNLAEKLNCGEADIKKIVPIKENGIVTGFNFFCRENIYCYEYKGDQLRKVNLKIAGN